MTPLTWHSGRGKTVRTENRFVVARRWAGVDFRGAPGNVCVIILIVAVVTRSQMFVKTQRTVS